MNTVLAAEAGDTTARNPTITPFPIFVAGAPAHPISGPRPNNTATPVSTITVSIFYLLAQMVGAGALVALLLGIRPGTTFLGMDEDAAKIATIIMVGALMIVYVTVGGMKGTTYVQIVKAFLLMGGATIMTVLVFTFFNFNLSSLLGEAADKSGKGDAFLEPGLRYG